MRPTAARIVVAIAWVGLCAQASARDPEPVLHERIPDDAAEDHAMHATIDGFPTAFEAGRTLLEAPDPRQPAVASAPVYAGERAATFEPDRDTSVPPAARYDDPFLPSTAPFKRLSAFDAVRDDYSLAVRDPDVAPLGASATQAPGEQTFFEDIVVDLGDTARVRIPSVGPGARVVRARLVGAGRDIPFRLLADGAENWFVERAAATAPDRARLVMQIAIAPEAFGGPLSDVDWRALPKVPRLPPNVERDASEVAAAIGVSRRMRPADAIDKLVEYFRSFVASEAPLRAHRNVYLDLTLAKRGVCRHRALGFVVTAQGLGIPARMVMNEVHGWVEVHDGVRWRRIDLGGAGTVEQTAGRDGERVAYVPPHDPFRWPDGAAPASASLSTAAPGSGDATASSAAAVSAAPSWISKADPPDRDDDRARADEATGASTGTGPGAAAAEDSPPSTIELHVMDADAHRGLPLRVYGTLRAGREPCPHAAIDVSLRAPSATHEVRVGTVATDDRGRFSGAIVLPESLPVGDYDVIAHTGVSGLCGEGTN